MARCMICSSARVKELNRWILTGRTSGEVAQEFGFNRQTVAYHKRRHLPFRSMYAKKPETADEKMKDLGYEFARLRALAECGEKVGEQLRVLVAERNLLELLMRKE